MTEPVRVRPPGRGVIIGCLCGWTLVQGAILGVVIQVVASVAPSRRDGVLLALLVIAAAAVAVPVLWAFAAVRRGIELRPDGIVVRRALSSAVLPWGQIAAIDVRGGHGVRSVVVRMTNGRTRRLPAPAETLVLKDPQFDATLQAIRQWWGNSRSATAS
jgi:hypothetical protein